MLCHAASRFTHGLSSVCPLWVLTVQPFKRSWRHHIGHYRHNQTRLHTLGSANHAIPHTIPHRKQEPGVSCRCQVTGNLGRRQPVSPQVLLNRCLRWHRHVRPDLDPPCAPCQHGTLISGHPRPQPSGKCPTATGGSVGCRTQTLGLAEQPNTERRLAELPQPGDHCVGL